MPKSLRSLAAAVTILAVLLLAPLAFRGGVAVDSARAQEGAPHFIAGEPGCGRVALIFNIGSGYEPAVSMLDTLAAYDVTATMFPMGWWAERYPEYVQLMGEYGFPVGSHGYDAPELTIRSDDDVAWDTNASFSAIGAALGYAPIPYHTPYAGSSDERVRWLIANQGYVPVGWDVRSADWHPEATASSVFDNVMSSVYDGAIVELHMDASTSTYSTAEALPWIIEALQARGYQLVSVPALAQPC